jgi:hypothetical protein
VLWAQATCTLTVSTATERNVDYVFRGVTELVLPRLQPWGPSVSINAFRVPSAGLFEIEMQSGDVIRIKAKELLPHASHNAL